MKEEKLAGKQILDSCVSKEGYTQYVRTVIIKANNNFLICVVATNCRVLKWRKIYHRFNLYLLSQSDRLPCKDTLYEYSISIMEPKSTECFIFGRHHISLILAELGRRQWCWMQNECTTRCVQKANSNRAGFTGRLDCVGNRETKGGIFLPQLATCQPGR